MEKLILNILILCLFLVGEIYPQQFSVGSPEWLVDMFFSKGNFPEKEDYFTGEMKKEVNEKTIGEELNGEANVSFHQIRATKSNCVYAVEVKIDSKTIDFYIYLVKDDNKWNITAVRRFLLPAFIHIVRDSLLELKTLSASDSVFLLSLQLFTSSDMELKNYIASNQEKFQELTSLFINNEKDKANNALVSVGCNAIYTDKKYPGCTFIQIQRFENFEAGFIQALDEVLLPAISYDEFIYVEEAVEGWYVYRIM